MMSQTEYEQGYWLVCGPAHYFMKRDQVFGSVEPEARHLAVNVYVKTGKPWPNQDRYLGKFASVGEGRREVELQAV